MKKFTGKSLTRRNWRSTSLAAALLTWTIGLSRAADIVWTNTAGGNWNVAANWSPNLAPGASDNAFITNSGNYTVTLNVTATVLGLRVGGASGQQTLSVGGNTLTLNDSSDFNTNTILTLNGGALTGGGTVTVNGTMNWEGGYLTGSGVTVIGSNSVVNLTGPNTKYLYQRTVNNYGTVNWSGVGSIWAELGAVFNNQAGALFDAQNDANCVGAHWCPAITLRTGRPSG